MITEEEAKTKWCPMVRRAPGGNNANADGWDRTTRCIASKCMMWRNVIDRGYCGLAGPTP